MEKHITFVGCKTQYCKDVTYPQIIYRLNEILLTIPEAFFFFFLVEIDRLILKYKRTAKTTLIKRNKVGELMLLDFKTSIKWKESGPCCKGMAINME